MRLSELSEEEGDKGKGKTRPFFAKGRQKIEKLRDLYRRSWEANERERFIPKELGARFHRTRLDAAVRGALPKSMWPSLKATPEETGRKVTLSAERLRKYGLSPGQMIKLGKDPKEVKAAGFTLPEFLADNIPFTVLKAIGYKIEDFVAAGVPSNKAQFDQLREAGFQAADVRYGLKLARARGQDLSKLYSMTTDGAREIKAIPPDERPITTGYTVKNVEPIGREAVHRVLHTDEKGELTAVKVTGKADIEDGEYLIRTPRGNVEIKKISGLITTDKAPQLGQPLAGNLIISFGDRVPVQVSKVGSVESTESRDTYKIKVGSVPLYVKVEV